MGYVSKRRALNNQGKHGQRSEQERSWLRGSSRTAAARDTMPCVGLQSYEWIRRRFLLNEGRKLWATWQTIKTFYVFHRDTDMTGA